MKDFWPTPSLPQDIAKLDERLRTTPDNLFDADILNYRDKLKFYCARTEGRPVLHMPVQNILMLDSLAVEPDATEMEVAKAIAVLMQFIIGKAIEQGYNEILFMVRDKSVATYAERHGFETMLENPETGTKLFRMKVKHICEPVTELSLT